MRAPFSQSNAIYSRDGTVSGKSSPLGSVDGEYVWRRGPAITFASLENEWHPAQPAPAHRPRLSPANSWLTEVSLHFRILSVIVLVHVRPMAVPVCPILLVGGLDNMGQSGDDHARLVSSRTVPDASWVRRSCTFP